MEMNHRRTVRGDVVTRLRARVPPALLSVSGRSLAKGERRKPAMSNNDEDRKAFIRRVIERVLKIVDDVLELIK